MCCDCDCENCECGCADEPNAAKYDYEDVAEQIFARIKNKPKEYIRSFLEDGVFSVENEFHRMFGEYPESMDFCSDVFSEVHARVSDMRRAASVAW